ncbi:MAG: glycine--tRNA ligase subunit beta [Gammaproteobacteria bacterium]|nr:MAG: glycine--tRNA ligase subunit beta [Gammaproteobacteria bacterium]
MSSTADFLVEIGTEELPPKALHRLELAFADSMREGIGNASLKCGEQTSFATPRRLAVLVKDLHRTQPTRVIEKRGPPTRIAFDDDGKPTQAAEKFAAGLGVTVAQLDRLSTDKGEWLVFRGEEPGKSALDLLPGIITAALAALPIPKRMRWGDSGVEFVRPVHWIVMLLGRDVIPAVILGITAGRETRGHRFHAPAALSIAKPADYVTTLEHEGRVQPDFATRMACIRTAAKAAAEDLGGSAVLVPEILEEVTALVEWPVPVTGRFDAAFLRLPDAVLIATLQDHQRYFPVRGPDGRLLPNFIAISNLESTDPDTVRKGNERVIQPRLADAAFFWDRDRRATLASRCDALANVVFQKELGSLLDKSMRVAALARALAAQLGEDVADAGRAAELAKADLLTEMVGEFPELQGRIGRYYAELDGEKDTVARAIEEQYLPLQAGGALPASANGRILAIAERLDSLAGIFAAGHRPTGNKDPFSLRRAALATLRILIERKIEIDLVDYLATAIAAQPIDVDDSTALRDDLYNFMIDRLRGYLLDGQAPNLGPGTVSAEVFESVRVRAPASPLDFYQRIAAVCSFMQLDAADALAAANKRIANILKSADAEQNGRVEPALFAAAEEQHLYEVLQSLADAHAGNLARRDYEAVLLGLASLRTPIDAFFDNVMVMTDDVEQQRNRLVLLTELRRCFLDVADLSCIPVN